MSMHHGQQKVRMILIRVPLTKGQFALVDDQDEWVLDFKWQARWNKGTQSFYAVRNIYKGGKHATTDMHREIMNAPKDMDVDHINHDTLDNRRENLEIKTHADNMHNSGKYRTNTSGYRGVSIHSKTKKWCAQLSHESYGRYDNHDNNRKFLGTAFDTAEDAARAYDAEKFRLTGSTLGLNFPEEYERRDYAITDTD
jgi:HNH endonuclease